MIRAPLSAGPIAQVLYNLRAADREELEATLWRFDSAALAEASAGARLGFVALADDGAPVAVLGANEVWPGVFQVGLFATPRWPEVALAVTRAVQRDLAPAIVAAGGHRAHAFSHAAHHEAHRWLKSLGARQEARLAGWGRRGEDFLLFVWTGPEAGRLTLRRDEGRANAGHKHKPSP